MLLRQVPIRSMQHVLVASKKRLVQGVQKCARTLAPREQKCGMRERLFYLLYFMHMNAARQSCVRY